jgi:tRNA(Arg) A34 adenosine deaminase TadA
MTVENNQCEESSSPQDFSSPAHQFDLFGWFSDQNLSDDENYMNIVYLITRSAKNGQQGHMGSLIVRPSSRAIDESAQDHSRRIFSNILGAATNVALFGTKDVTSDIHAEISALGQACQASRSTTGCTAYITIPPCRRCFAALVAFGIRRILTRQESPQEIRETAAQRGIEVVSLTREQNRRQMQRINQLVNPDRTDQELMEIAERNKLQRQERKNAKKNANQTPN